MSILCDSYEEIMSILQEKKVAVVLALIVMILGSILYFNMDVSQSELMKENAAVINDAQVQNSNESSNVNIPLIENNVII